ncbi:hypothetical protein L6164_016149 [Bauhinia variegata]|uniref:Uncharacterized protein n=1 Tax=Bauhinia variegata TaxID=167791 RepID=A0ACB9NNV6_BAUVA|nr:hypothetical protein L6164_016149 [Bauhinia variegata]
MDGKANLRSLIRPIHPDTTPSSSSPQDFLRSVQAALKRHRPIGVTQSNNILPKRTLVPQREASRSSTSNTSPIADAKKSQGMPLSQERSEKDSLLHKKNTMSVVGVYQEDASITPPSISGTCTNTFGEGCNPFKAQERHPKEMANCEDKNTLPSLQVESQNINALKKVQFAIGSNNTGQGADDRKATELENLSSHMGSHALTEMEWIASGQLEASTTAMAVPASNSSIEAEKMLGEKNGEQQGGMVNESSASKSIADDKSTKRKESADVGIVQPQAPISKTSSVSKLVSSKLEKQEKAEGSKGASAARKRTYDPDLFFKVNGSFIKGLIKLRGRDYATAYGFCQEIEYLNNLKGKNNIIQLIDYEVTDKALLDEVMRGGGSLSNKDRRVKDDGYIFMVLEYGEIDLAHMLSQKWKELDGCNQTIDENWLRFYWQQILRAVNTIHEERMVHSDLKPANFLLVKGSLKLIDFGIAKAIMSDTTNIQRDSQVGTLSYMSPEAFLCNENDANGNIIKCGRSSDICSLGCILYQMVYGRTPFSEYKTFWAKFKVITDPNHEIAYEPVSNHWLLDLMKRCLVWDRNERWRIPQLLQHPFLVPPVPQQPSSTQYQSCKLLQLIAETCIDDPEASQLCSQLQQLLGDPPQLIAPDSLKARSQQRKILSQMSRLCFQLQERLRDTDAEWLTDSLIIDLIKRDRKS